MPSEQTTNERSSMTGGQFLALIIFGPPLFWLVELMAMTNGRFPLMLWEALHGRMLLS